MTHDDQNKRTIETITWAQLQKVATMVLSEEDLGDFATPRELVNCAVGGLPEAKRRCIEILNRDRGRIS